MLKLCKAPVINVHNFLFCWPLSVWQFLTTQGIWVELKLNLRLRKPISIFGNLSSTKQLCQCPGCEYLDVSLTAVSCAVLMCSKVNITFWQYLWNYFSPGSNINAFSLNCQRSQLSAKRNFASRAFFSNQIKTSLFVFPLLLICFLVTYLSNH